MTLREYANGDSVIFPLQKLDMLQMTVRDALVLFVVIKRPGITGADIAAELGLGSRSLVQYVIKRQKARGLITDNRKTISQGHPSNFRATVKGKLLWDQIEGR
tara:strand:- start:412 stop:720 length:309 start_codon:yes stop_codon:yes gene_type:complete